MTQPETVEPKEVAAEPTDSEVLAVLLWHAIKQSGKKIREVAEEADVATGTLYAVLNQRQGISQKKYSLVMGVLPVLFGLASSSEKSLRVVPTADGIAKYQQLVRSGEALLFRDDPQWGVDAVVPKRAPTPPPKAPEARTRIVTKPIPLNVLSGLLWILGDPKRRKRLEVVAEYLKETGTNLHDLLQAVREDEEG